MYPPDRTVPDHPPLILRLVRVSLWPPLCTGERVACLVLGRCFEAVEHNRAALVNLEARRGVSLCSRNNAADSIGDRRRVGEDGSVPVGKCSIQVGYRQAVAWGV